MTIEIRTNKQRFAEDIGDKWRVITSRKRYFVKSDKKRWPKSPLKLEAYYSVKPLHLLRHYIIPKLDYVGSDGFIGGYLNCDLSTKEYDAMFIKSDLPRKYIALESSLMTTKWFDYRFMHHIEATYLFTRYYTNIYGQFIAKMYDHEKGNYAKGFKGDDWLKINKTHRQGLVKSRMTADKFGIPYPFFIRFAMEWCVWNRIWREPPKPNQLYIKEMVTEMIEAWAAHCKDTVPTPIDERYMLETDVDGDNQKAYRYWLMDTLLARPHPEIGLNTYLNKIKMLKHDEAKEYMPQHYRMAMSA